METTGIVERDSIEAYRRDVAAYRLLSDAEMIDLARRRDAGDRAAYDALVHHNLRLVMSLVQKQAARWRHSSMTFLDAVQAGNLGLMVACAKWEWKRGVKLSSLVAWWVRDQIGFALEKASDTMRIPRYVHVLRMKLKSGRHLTPSERRILALVPMATLSLEQATPTYEETGQAGETGTLADTISDPNPASNPEAALMARQDAADQRATLTKALSVLTPTARLILARRFGFGPCPDIEHETSYAEIASDLGMGYDRVCRIGENALKTLREVLSRDTDGTLTLSGVVNYQLGWPSPIPTPRQRKTVATSKQTKRPAARLEVGNPEAQQPSLFLEASTTSIGYVSAPSL